MPKISELFISPHAVEKFQQRIAPVSEARARFFIGEGIRSAPSAKLLPDEDGWRIRTKPPFPFAFRAYVVFDRKRGNYVVTTIVRGDSCVTRQHKRRHGGTRSNSHESSGRQD